jgi:hypothetical protein
MVKKKGSIDKYQNVKSLRSDRIWAAGYRSLAGIGLDL